MLHTVKCKFKSDARNAQEYKCHLLEQFPPSNKPSMEI